MAEAPDVSSLPLFSLSGALRTWAIKAALAGLEAAAFATERVAREKAPVRKVFMGGRQKPARALTRGEQREYRAFTGESGAFVRTRDFGSRNRRNRAVHAARFGDTTALRYAFIETKTKAFDIKTGKSLPGYQREVAEGFAGTPGRGANFVRNEELRRTIKLRLSDEAEDRLTSRGKYELRSGRALTRAGELGGRLRNSIRTEDPEVKGGRFIVSIRAYAPYARYVEFGTRHAAAQPFLRPALAQAREILPREVMRSLRRPVK